MDDPQKILDFYPPDCQPTRIEALGSAGGLSGALFWRIVAPRGILMLRCWPIEHPSPQGLEFIHAVLRHSAAHGMSILPVPLGTSRGESFVRHQGRLWELAPWLSGTADYDRSPRREKLCAAMSALARFHVSVVDFPATTAQSIPRVSAPAVLNRLARLRDLQNGDAEELNQALTDSTWPELTPLAREFIARLPQLLPCAIAPLAPFADQVLPIQVCLRDVWHDHILFQGDMVTGVVDFGAIEFDTPATDVARLLGSLVADDQAAWNEGLEAYARVRPISAAERTLIPALDLAGTVLAGCNWIRWIYGERRRFDDPGQVITRFERLLSRIRRLVTL